MKAWILALALAAGGCASVAWSAPELLSRKAEGVPRQYGGPEEKVWASSREVLYSYGGLVEENRAGRTLLSVSSGDARLAAWIEPEGDGWRVTFLARRGSPMTFAPSEEAMHGRLASALAR